MALKIIQEEDSFLIQGIINSSTVKQFKNHLEFLLLYTKALTININEVKSIDRNGMYVIRNLHTKALINNKKFSVIGYDCKEIYDDFENKPFYSL